MPQINARDWLFEVNAEPDTEPAEWARVRGLESFDLNPSEGEESTETTNFDSEGHAESQAMQRGASLALEGKKLLDGDGAKDAGQAAVEALAEQLGEDSLGGVRFRHKSQDEWTVWTAWASLGSNSGGNNDKTSWSCTFTRSGKPDTAQVTNG